MGILNEEMAALKVELEPLKLIPEQVKNLDITIKKSANETINTMKTLLEGFFNSQSRSPTNPPTRVAEKNRKDKNPSGLPTLTKQPNRT